MIACSHRIENKQERVTRIGTFEVSFPTHVALRMFLMQVLASQLHFLANRNAGLAIPPLFWPVNCIKIGEHVALLSGPTVHSLYCDTVLHCTEYKEKICLSSQSLRIRSTCLANEINEKPENSEDFLNTQIA